MMCDNMCVYTYYTKYGTLYVVTMMYDNIVLLALNSVCIRPLTGTLLCARSSNVVYSYIRNERLYTLYVCVF
jgi:hypothetical protein